MKSNQNTHINFAQIKNLIHHEAFKKILDFQSKIGLAYRSGNFPQHFENRQIIRLVNNHNLLTKGEVKNLIFTNEIFFN